MFRGEGKVPIRRGGANLLASYHTVTTIPRFETSIGSDLRKRKPTYELSTAFRTWTVLRTSKNISAEVRQSSRKAIMCASFGGIERLLSSAKHHLCFSECSTLTDWLMKCHVESLIEKGKLSIRSHGFGG